MLTGQSNDNPFREQKNGAVVRRYAFNYRYDTEYELAGLNELWPLVNLPKNLFQSTKKVTGYQLIQHGKSARSYDNPRTPANRIKDTGIRFPAQRQHMKELYNRCEAVPQDAGWCTVSVFDERVPVMVRHGHGLFGLSGVAALAGRVRLPTI